MRRWHTTEESLFCAGLVAAVVVGLGSTAWADFTFAAPVNLGPAVNSPYSDISASISADGLSLFFSTNRPPGGYRDFDLWAATRGAPNEDWGAPVHMDDTVNSRGMEWTPCISADGLELYFAKGTWGDTDIVVSRRASESEPWGTPENLGPVVNSAAWDTTPCISADSLELLFCSTRGGGYGGPNLYVTKRTTASGSWGPPVNLGPSINSGYGSGIYGESNPSLSSDGLMLFYNSARPPGSASNLDIWMTRRPTRDGEWGPPVHLAYPINGPYVDAAPCVSADGHTLYFVSDRPGGIGGDSDFWQAPIVPIVDFNGDGKVDEEDLLVMTQYWGRDYPLCDIGPMPWGDGVVDGDDFLTFMKTMEGHDLTLSPSPHALEVPRDAMLSWTSPNFAKVCDVYFGTSFADVNSADRANPRGVLIAEGQTATSYDPPGFLEYGQTYYWRLDFVSAGPAPIIYKGPVLEFTSETFAHPIKNITATASSAQAGSGPERTVDGSGLDKTDGHSTDQKDMWWSMPEPSRWIQYEFDKVYTLHELWVWNFNMIIEPSMGFGAKTVKIEYCTDGTTWTPLASVPEFAKAPGQPGYTANTIVDFAAVPAKFVKLTIEKNWGVAPQTGLSEVRFFAIQTAAIPKP